MIGSIKGKVAELANEYCLIETPGGVGYRVFMPSANLAALTMGSEVRVHTYTSGRDDAILLFGFLQKQYYDLFVLCLGRVICSWLCPFGLVQDLLYKIPSPKLHKNAFTQKLSLLYIRREFCYAGNRN